MKLINVFKRFVLTLNSTPQWFETGVHEVEAAVASHWHTLEHATVVEVEKPFATAKAMADADAEQALAKAEAEADAAKADAAAELKAAEAKVAEEIKAAEDKLASFVTLKKK